MIWGYQYGLTQSITVAAIMFPVMLKIGTEKNELIILISAFFAGIFMLIVAVLLAPWTAGINLRSGLVGTAALSVSPLLLLISYFISLRIYKNKEF
nr:ABC-2 transporter permease [[Clostridium] symbiosum]